MPSREPKKGEAPPAFDAPHSPRSNAAPHESSSPSRDGGARGSSGSTDRGDRAAERTLTEVLSSAGSGGNKKGSSSSSSSSHKQRVSRPRGAAPDPLNPSSKSRSSEAVNEHAGAGDTLEASPSVRTRSQSREGGESPYGRTPKEDPPPSRDASPSGRTRSHGGGEKRSGRTPKDVPTKRGGEDFYARTPVQVQAPKASDANDGGVPPDGESVLEQTPKREVSAKRGGEDYYGRTPKGVQAPTVKVQGPDDSRPSTPAKDGEAAKLATTADVVLGGVNSALAASGDADINSVHTGSPVVPSIRGMPRPGTLLRPTLRHGSPDNGGDAPNAEDANAAARARLSAKGYVSESNYFYWAATWNHANLKLLKERAQQASRTEAMTKNQMLRTARDHPLVLEVLHEFAPSVNVQRLAVSRNQAQQTALHAAVTAALDRKKSLDDDIMQDVYETALALVELGVDVNAADPSRAGMSALHLAAELANPGLVQLLLEAGASALRTDTFGRTPLHVLCSSPNHVDSDKSGGMMRKMLTVGGADARLPTISKQTPVFLLVENLLHAINFKENQSGLHSIDEERLSAAFNMLEVLLSDPNSTKEEGVIDVNQPCFTGHNLSLHKIRGVKMCPLALLVIAIRELQRIQRRGRRALIPDEATDLALRSTLRCARLLLDNGAKLHSPMRPKTSTFAPKSEGGSILNQIVRSQIKLLIIHPRVQSEINKSWGPDYTFDRKALTEGKVRWLEREDYNRLGVKVDEKLAHHDHSTHRSLRQVLLGHWVSRRRAFCTSFCFFVLWVAAITYCAMHAYIGAGDGGYLHQTAETDSFRFSASMRDRVIYDELDESINDNGAFLGIQNLEESWRWLRGPLLNLNNNFNDPSRQDKLIAPIRLRQFRASHSEKVCKTPTWAADNRWTQNFASDSVSNRATDDLRCVVRFILGGDDENRTQDAAGLKYTDQAEDYQALLPGRFGLYYGESGGFSVSLTQLPKSAIPAAANVPTFDDNLNVQQILNVLEAVDWIDESTAIVLAEAVLYNQNLNRFAAGRFALQFSVAGEVSPWFESFVIKLDPYEQPTDFIVLVVEVIVVVIASFKAIREVLKILRGFDDYFRDFWNGVDLLTLVLIGLLVIMRFVTASVRATLREQIDGDVESSLNVKNATGTSDEFLKQSALFEPMWRLGFYQKREREIASLLLILLYCSMLKFLRLYPDIGILLRIVQKEVRDAGVFLVIYLAFLVGYAVAFHVLVGTDYEDFSTIGLSCVTLFSLSVGDFKFFPFATNGEWLALFLFLSYIALTLVLLLNLLIAMLNQSYANVYEEASLEYLSERAKIVQSYAKRQWKAKAIQMETEVKLKQRPAIAMTDGEEELLRRIAHAMGVAVVEGEDEKPTTEQDLTREIHSSNLKMQVENKKNKPKWVEGTLQLITFLGSGSFEIRFVSKKKWSFVAEVTVDCVFSLLPGDPKHPWQFWIQIPSMKRKVFACPAESSVLGWEQKVMSCIVETQATNINVFDSAQKLLKGTFFRLFLDKDNPGTAHSITEQQGRQMSRGVLWYMREQKGYKVFSSSLSVGDVESFIRPASLLVRNQPRTQNVPYSSVLVDLGQGRRLFLSSISLEFLGNARHLAPQQWILQGTNSEEAAGFACGQNMDNPRKQESLPADSFDDGALAAKVLDLRWTTLILYNRDVAAEELRSGQQDMRHSIKLTVPCWAGLTSILQTKARSRSPMPGGFRFFRLVQVGANTGKVSQRKGGGANAITSQAQLVNASKSNLSKTNLEFVTENPFSLSFCGLELYGGLIGGASRERQLQLDRGQVEHSMVAMDPDAQSPRGGEDTGLESANHTAELEAEAELIEEAANSEQFGVLFKALRASMARTNEVTREGLRQRLDHQLSVLGAQQRSLEQSIEYVRRHMDISDYGYVFGAGGE